MTYSHMGKPHTTIGAKRFHYWVRDGIRWFPLAIVVRQFCRDGRLRGLLMLWTIGWMKIVICLCIQVLCFIPSSQTTTTRILQDLYKVLLSCLIHIITETADRLKIKQVLYRGQNEFRPRRMHDYMVKPHVQLVLVSSMHRCTYTPSLSTS